MPTAPVVTVAGKGGGQLGCHMLGPYSPAVTSEELIGRRASTQHGLIAIRQLTRLGVTKRQAHALVERGVLIIVRRSVYRVMGHPTTWESAVLAAILAADPSAVASHQTAGVLWDLKHCDRHAIDTVHLSSSRQVRLAGVTGHRPSVPAHDRRTLLGIPVTSAQRTVIDLAGSLSVAQLGECLDDGLRRGLVHLERLRRTIDQVDPSGRRGWRALRQVLADRLPGYQPGANDWEREMDRQWDALGLPPAVRQLRVRANGRRYTLDRAIPALLIGVEWNGFETHGTRSGFDRDSDKRADLTAAGWHMLDFTSRSSPERICRAVLAAVAQRTSPPGRTAVA